ncbi:J domain-containing protein [Marimonas arenosa]|uniref:J domain-containing protein n=1 Tax=Marimonas arenosa TaxID=1795305 RepID=A0AAE4B6P0_9RHOB|nr:DnaJ domain-containing protein [Marimonas arenosa]MDQ2092302.1 J domain-containing protein [Marimonas arenosa]
MIGFFRKLFGEANTADVEENLEIARPQSLSSNDKSGSHERDPFEEMEREARERFESMSSTLPGGDYFELLEALQRAIADRRYSDAAEAAYKSISPLRKWLSDPRRDWERDQITIPALQQGGTMMAIIGNQKGLEELRDIVNEFDHLAEYRPDAEKHFKSLLLFDRIRRAVSEKPGILQNKMKAELGEEDGRLVSNLISWLEKAGEITRAKSGKTYALYMAGAQMTEEDASAIYTEPPRPSSHQKERQAARALELDLDKLDLVPLPPSPYTWSKTEELPTTSETFSDPAGSWRNVTIEAIAPPDRPDPAFRKHFTTSGGVLSFDDLAKSEESRGAAGAVMFTPEVGGEPIIRSLKRPPYYLDVHPEGKGFASRSKANILTVYDERLEVDFETDLSTTPEVQENRKRFDLDGAGAGAVLWGEPHLALNCIALSPRRDRYVYSHVDEAWCIDRDGKRLWGIRMPERPVETHSQTFDVGGIGGQVGTALEIEQALDEMNLKMPVTPEEIRQRYRTLVRELHPDINPGGEDRMKVVNTAYETLTGASQDELQGNERADDLLSLSATITFTFGGGPDRIQAAAFSGSGDTVLLGTDEGRVLRIDSAGRPIALYDVGSAPERILETDNYLYIQTFTRLYVLDGDRLVGLQDCTTKSDLLVDEGMVLLVENKGVRVLSETGRALATVLTKAPIRRAGIEKGELVIETRTHRGRFSGLGN